MLVTLETLQYLYQVIQEYEWGFLEVEGGALRMLEPGLHYAQRGKVTRVDRRTHVMNVKELEMHTRDDRVIKVTFFMFVRVVDPERTVRFEPDWRLALVQTAHGELPRVVERWTAEDAYWERWRLAREMTTLLNPAVKDLGVVIESIHVEDVLHLV